MIKLFLLFAAIIFAGTFLFRLNQSVWSQTASCALQSQGDINCSGAIDLVDFEIWRKGYMAAQTPGTTGTIVPTPTGISGTPPIITGTPPVTTGTPSPSGVQSITPPPGASPQSETSVSPSSIPQAVQNALDQRFPNNAINQAVKRTFSNGAIDYAIELDDAQGTTYDVWVLPDGTITNAQPA